MQKNIKNIKKIVSLAICLALVISCFAVNAFAADLVNSVGSVAEDFAAETATGNDNTQGKSGEYQLAADGSTATAETKTVGADVYATKASTYSVKIPKTIVVGGADGAAAYSVGVKGDITGNQTITVAPVDADTTTAGINFSLAEQGTVDAKAATIATVTQAKTSFTQSEINAADWTLSNGAISATLTAGVWNGTMNFTVSITNA